MATQFQNFDETVTDIEDTLGTVPEWMEGIPEEDLVREWPTFKHFLFGDWEMDPKTREMVGLAVAAAIGCEYCRHFHKGAAQLHGATEEELAELSFLASYTPRYSSLINAQDYDMETFQAETAEIAEHLQSQMAAADD